MNFSEKHTIRIAIVDLYEGFENQGMRCLHEILGQFAKMNHINIISSEFDVRQKKEIPDFSWDIYISTGGPEARWIVKVRNGIRFILTG